MVAHVYIMASDRNGTLYVGVTTNLIQRVYDHKQKQTKGFTEKYNVIRLVWYDEYFDVRDAILREKQIKAWQRAWKIRVIEEFNPQWKDLYETLA